MSAKPSDRGGKRQDKLPLEERGDTKLHLLSPRRHPRAGEERASRARGEGGRRAWGRRRGARAARRGGGTPAPQGSEREGIRKRESTSVGGEGEASPGHQLRRRDVVHERAGDEGVQRQVYPRRERLRVHADRHHRCGRLAPTSGLRRRVVRGLGGWRGGGWRRSWPASGEEGGGGAG
jgi:hypothetical protein